jgi:putative transposase
MYTSIIEVLRRPVESGEYLSSYTERLEEAGAVASVGSKGDSYDNALAESFNGLYKTELIHRRGPWKNADDVEWATLIYIDWFNNRQRRHSALGMMSPIEFEARRTPTTAA